MRKILVIDDEVEMLNSIQKILSRHPEFETIIENVPQMALEKIKRFKYDLIITDLKMNEFSGMDVLSAAKKSSPKTKVIMVTGYGTEEGRLEANGKGAFDFIEKPFTGRRFVEAVTLALRAEDEDNVETEVLSSKVKNFNGFIYKSQTAHNLIEMVKKVAEGNMSVLITGESGTGKDLIARAIHDLSDRKEDTFVPVNCSALPEHLFESELFGYTKGAFTGAVKTKPGLFEFANQGTFFLDEIGEMSFELQAKLLRTIEDQKIRRVGDTKEINIDVRIISATNQNLSDYMAAKKFRQDLFYRLSQIEIQIPPLRKRVEDIIPLAKYFLNQICTQNGKTQIALTDDSISALEGYSWPGNARELYNVLTRACFSSEGKVLHLKDLPIPGKECIMTINEDLLDLQYKEAKQNIIEKFEIEYLTHNLSKNEGNISKTASECGIDRRTIHRLLNEYQIIYKK